LPLVVIIDPQVAARPGSQQVISAALATELSVPPKIAPCGQPLIGHQPEINYI
jgi:hypothetical protein